MLLSYQNPFSAFQNPESLHPESKIHGANKGPTWVLSAPDGPHVGPMNLAIGVGKYYLLRYVEISAQVTCCFFDEHHIKLTVEQWWLSCGILIG